MPKLAMPPAVVEGRDSQPGCRSPRGTLAAPCVKSDVSTSRRLELAEATLLTNWREFVLHREETRAKFEDVFASWKPTGRESGRAFELEQGRMSEIEQRLAHCEDQLEKRVGACEERLDEEALWRARRITRATDSRLQHRFHNIIGQAAEALEVAAQITESLEIEQGNSSTSCLVRDGSGTFDAAEALLDSNITTTIYSDAAGNFDEICESSNIDDVGLHSSQLASVTTDYRRSVDGKRFREGVVRNEISQRLGELRDSRDKQLYRLEGFQAGPEEDHPRETSGDEFRSRTAEDVDDMIHHSRSDRSRGSPFASDPSVARNSEFEEPDSETALVACMK